MTHLKNIRIGLIILLLGLLAIPIFAQSEIVITARQNLALQSKPDYDSDVLGVFQRRQEAAAFGRDEAGAWLQINDGWVIAKNVDAAADIMALPVTTNAVTVKAAASRSLRSGPDDSFDATGNLPAVETALALGRNGDGSWLQVSGGWVMTALVKVDGDIMALPITFSSITIRANQNVALHRGPSRDAEVLAILARGEEAIATSRNEAGTAVQTPRGWVFVNRGLVFEGEIMDLPLAPTVSVTAAQALTLYSGPSLDYFERLAVVKQGEQNIAFGRDETGIWLQIPGGWVSTEQGLETRGDVMRLPITGYAGITITIRFNTTVRTGSSGSSGVVRRLQQGEEAIAFGRNEDGKRLRIEDGWVLASMVRVDGDIMDLPIVGRSGITIISTSSNTPVRTRSSALSDRLGALQRGEEAIAFGRNKAGTWLQIKDGWVVASWVKADGDIMLLPVTSGESSTQSTAKVSSRDGVTITPTLPLGSTIRSGPGSAFDMVGSLRRGEEATVAIGRNEDGRWLRIEDGWVLASYVTVNGDIMSLPVTSGESSAQSVAKTSSRDGVTVTATINVQVHSEPYMNDAIKTLPKGEAMLAIGRYGSTWLQIEDGWIYRASVEADDNIMSLPITWEGSSSATSSTTTSTRRATPTPSRSSSSTSAFNEQTIRSRVNRYTDDIRILKINQSGSTTEIEYDLKPWPFVPNEQIAHEVLFKVICALRRGGQIPHKLEFTGQGHFKSDVGRKFRSPSVEIHISANNANRVICSGNTYSDINWRSLAARYQSYPIPSGARVDYD